MRLPISISLFLLSMAAAAEPAPPFTAEAAGGQALTLPREHEGADIYLFWATWCPYCQRLMPHIQSIQDEYGDRVEVFAINFRDDGDPAAYIGERGFEFVLVPDGDDIARQYGMHGTPGLVLVDGSGEIRFNLYRLQNPARKALEDLGHAQRAERLAPWWAAQIRREIDLILDGG